MMEPVPETERMEEFRSSPLPSLRLHSITTSFPPEPTTTTNATRGGDCDSVGGSPTSTISLASTTSTTSVTPTAPSKPATQRPSAQLSTQKTDPGTLSTAVDFVRKPQTIRRSTDPTPTSPQSASSPWLSNSSSTSSLHSPSYYSPPMSSSSPSFSSFSSSTPILPYRPRTTSPLSLSQSTFSSHTRSRSHASTLSPPPMGRTQSMPSYSGSTSTLFLPQGGGYGRPASPSSPARPTSRARRAPVDEVFPTSPVRHSVLESDRRVTVERSESPTFGTGGRYRRSTSPLRHPAHSSMPSLTSVPSTPTSMSSSMSSMSSSPSSRAIDSFPMSSSYGSSNGLYLSSIPTTPTSARSRSPSISSLETIPDSPGAEEEALEAERIAQLKAAAEAAENSEPTDPKAARNSLEVPSRGRNLGGFGSRDKRKRWSVCGAERRGDLNLDTIWED